MGKLLTFTLALITLSIASLAQTTEWIRTWGGTQNDRINFTKTDSNGFVYVLGSTASHNADFDPGPGQVIVSGDYFGDVFVSKFDNDGSLVWCKVIEGTYLTLPNNLDVDDYGNVYIAGRYNGVIDLDPGVAEVLHNGPSYSPTNWSVSDMFVVKLDANGEYVWGETIHGDTEYVSDMEVGVNGSVYMTGSFRFADFDPGPNVYELEGEWGDLYVLKLSNQGEFVWVKSLEQPSSDSGNGLQLDSIDNIYLCGRSWGSYVAKWDSSGNVLWEEQIGTEAIDILLGEDGKPCVLGTYSGLMDLDPGPDSLFLPPPVSGTATYLSKLNTDGDLIWARSLGTVWYGDMSMVMDSVGNHYIAGSIGGDGDLDPGPNVHLVSTSGHDIALLKLDSIGNYVWAKQYGGYSTDEPGELVIDNDGSLFLTGFYFQNADFDPGIGVNTLPDYGDLDVFLMKMNPCLESTATLNLTGCTEALSLSQNIVWTQNGTYMDVIESSSGCDSIVTVNLTLLSTYDTLDVFVCDSFVSPSQNQVWYTSGLYHDTIPNTAGCDSILTISLEVGNTFRTIYQSVCDSYLSPSGNYTYTSTGIYSDTVPNSVGCDSIITVNLTVSNSGDTAIYVSTCDAYTSPSGSHVWTTSAIYQDTIPTLTGCDSVITVHLSVLSTSYDTVAVEYCENYISPSGNYVYTSSGGYSDTIPNSVGCDSIIQINLTIIDIDTSVSVSGNILNSNSVGTMYQWIDCYSQNPVNGASGSEFIATSNGTYAVIIQQGSCADTSSCYEVNSLTCHASFTLYPDPLTAHSWFAVDSSIGSGQLEYLWDWGDGTTSIGANPSHVYDTAGYYNICLTVTDPIDGCVDTYCDSSTFIYKTMQMVTVNVVSELPNGIHQAADEHDFIVYPNPTTSTITLKTETPLRQAWLTDLTGRKLMPLQPIGAQWQADLSQLPSGMYLIDVLTQEGRRGVKKVVRE